MKINQFLFFIFLFSVFVFAQNEKDSIIINEWLSLGNFTIAFPALNNNKKYNVKDILSFNDINIKSLHPRENQNNRLV